MPRRRAAVTHQREAGLVGAVAAHAVKADPRVSSPCDRVVLVCALRQVRDGVQPAASPLIGRCGACVASAATIVARRAAYSARIRRR